MIKEAKQFSLFLLSSLLSLFSLLFFSSLHQKEKGEREREREKGLRLSISIGLSFIEGGLQEGEE